MGVEELELMLKNDKGVQVTASHLRILQSTSVDVTVWRLPTVWKTVFVVVPTDEV